MADTYETATMRMLAQALDEVMNPGLRGKDKTVGFVLLTFNMNEPIVAGQQGRTNYISNGADRKDIAVMMKEVIARFEGQPEIVGRG